MDLIRQPLGGQGATDPADLRVRQLQSQQLLRGELNGADLDKYVESRVFTTTMDKAVTWARSNAIFPATFGLACCAIEMITLVGSRLDIARIGSEAMRASPRQADLRGSGAYPLQQVDIERNPAQASDDAAKLRRLITAPFPGARPMQGNRDDPIALP